VPLTAPAVPVAVKPTGFPVRPTAAVAERLFEPAMLSSTQVPTAATPFAAVVVDPPVTLPCVGTPRR